MTAFGTGPWGVGGFGVDPNLTIISAHAISTHEVVVVLSKPPKDVLNVLDGDVSNPLSWELTVPDPLGSPYAMSVIGVNNFTLGSAVTPSLLESDGYVEFTAGPAGDWLAVGLTTTIPDHDYVSMDYVMFIGAGAAALRAVEFGAAVSADVGYVPGDILRVERVGTIVTYKKNGAVFHTSAAPSTAPVYVKFTANQGSVTGLRVFRSGGEQQVNWVNTNIVITGVETWEVLEVASVQVYASPLSWVVRSLDAFPTSVEIVRVKATGLRDAANNIISLPDSADFAGVTEFAVATPTALASSRNIGGRDLQNLSTPKIGGDTNLSGTLVIRGGDYALVEGPELIQKLLVRRLTTVPGDFFHLPEYGVGLRSKSSVPSGGLARLRAAIERHLLLERGVSNVVASISQSANTLTVRVRAVLARTGQQVSVGLDTTIGQ